LQIFLIDLVQQDLFVILGQLLDAVGVEAGGGTGQGARFGRVQNGTWRERTLSVEKLQ